MAWNDGDTGTAGTGPTPLPEAEPRPKWGSGWGRWLLRVAIGVAGLVALIVAIGHFAAGHLARAQLERMGINSEGVSSLQVDLWRSEVRLSAVEFWSAHAEPGRIENATMTYGLGHLFAKRALIDQMVVEGIDLRVSRDIEGAITVNGINLADFFVSEEVEEVEGDDPGGFGVGLDSFLLKDSRLLLEVHTGGQLMIEVERLIIEEMRSWDPDHPAVVTMTARVNDIGVQMKAEAHLFAETLMADVHLLLESVEIAKVAEFTGPLGFERRKGALDVRLISSVQIEPDGRVFAAGLASIVHDEVDLVRPGLEYRATNEHLAVSGVVIAEPRPLALSAPAPAAGEPQPAGSAEAAPMIVRGLAQARLKASGLEAKAADVGGLEAETVDVVLHDIAVLSEPDGRLYVATRPTVEIVGPRASGPVELDSDVFAVELMELGVSLHGNAVTITTDGNTRTGPMKLEVPGEHATTPALSTDGIQLAFEAVKATITPDRAEIDGRLRLKAEQVAMVTPAAAAAALGLATLSGLGLDVGALALILRGAGQDALGAGQTRQEAPTGDVIAEIAYRGLEIQLADLQVAAGDGLQLGSTGSVAIDAIDLSLAEEGSVSTLSLADTLTTFDESRLSLGSDGGTELSARWRFDATQVEAETPIGEGSATLNTDAVNLDLHSIRLEVTDDDLTVAITGDSQLFGIQTTAPAAGERPPSAVSLGQLNTTVEALDAEVGPRGVEIGGRLALSLAGLDAETAVEGSPATLALGAYQLGVAELEFAASEAGLALSAAGSTELEGLQARLGQVAGRPPMALELGAYRQSIDRFEATMEPGAVAWSLAAEIEGEAIAMAVEAEAPGAVQLDHLELVELQVDQSQAVAADSLILAGLDVELSDQTLTALAGGALRDDGPIADDDGAGDGEGAAPPARLTSAGTATAAPRGTAPTIRLDRLAVEPPALIRFADNSVDPPVVVVVDVERLEVTNIDTAEPGQRMDVALSAMVNEFTDLDVTGWAAPMQTEPDFDFEVEVDDLELPALSPYALRTVGMNLDSGTLSTATNAAAAGGKLDGLISLEVLDLILTPASAEDAKKASTATGLPIGTVIAVLKDDEGKIAMELPLSGSLDAPEVDLSDAINQAVGGSLKAVFPSTMLANVLSPDGSRFEPILFAPGQAELDDAGEERAEAFADLLKDKPKLDLLVCGRATAADGAAPPPAQSASTAAATAGSAATDVTTGPGGPTVDEAAAPAASVGRAAYVAHKDSAARRDSGPMIELAEARARAVKAYLVEERKLPAERVRECRPTFSAGDNGPPRADLSLI